MGAWTKVPHELIKAHLNKQIYECGAHEKQRTEVESVCEEGGREGWRDGWADKQLQFLSTALCNSLPTPNRADLYGHVQILGNTSCVLADKEMWRTCARTHTLLVK